MKNNKNLFFISIIFFVIFMIPFSVLAVDENPGGELGGESGETGKCNPSVEYCYYSQGLRFSVYKYDSSSKVLTTIKTIDYGIKDTGKSMKNITATIASSTPRSKLYYLDNGYSVKFSSSKKLDVVALSGISSYYDKCYVTTGCYDFSKRLLIGILDKVGIKIVGSSLKLKSGVDAKKLVQNLEKIFKISGYIDYNDPDELSKIYFAIEPTIAVYTKKGGLHYYYGSSYEMRSLVETKGSLKDVTNLLKNQLPESIRITKSYGELDNSLKNKYGLKTAPDVSNVKWNNMKTKGYGINIISIGSLFKTCNDTCFKYAANSNARLQCAENYCEKDKGSTTSAKKKQCIINCNYADPGKLSCPAGKCTTTNSSTVCGDNKNTKSTYSKCTSSDYFKIQCTQDITKLIHSNDLPKVLQLGVDGFNYSVKVEGNKTCTVEFNYKKYQFEYAALKKSYRDGNSDPEKALKDYQNLSSVNSSYNYDSATDSINLKAEGKDYNLKKVTNDISDATITSEGSKLNVYKISDNKMTKIEPLIPKTKTYTSNASIFYELPKQCYSIRQGAIYLPSIDNVCDPKKGDVLSYGVYSNNKEKGVKSVVVTSKMNNGCLNNKHTCYYVNGNPDKAAKCWINYEDISGDSTKFKVTFNIENRKMLKIGYVFDMNSGVTNNTFTKVKTITKTSTDTKEISGRIVFDYEGETINIMCPATLPAKNKTGPNCEAEIGGKNARYEEIQSFCREHWKEDVNNYSSERACVDSCGGPIEDSCKKISYTNQAGIKDWCRNETNRKKAGYKSEEACLNDCLITNDSKEYIYRPIALGGTGTAGSLGYNAFPKRSAGSNWIGYEEKYTTNKEILDSSKNSPVYVIELDKKTIAEIRKDTKSKGKKVYLYNNDDYDKNDDGELEYYKSSYIKANPQIFTKVGTGTGC